MSSNHHLTNKHSSMEMNFIEQFLNSLGYRVNDLPGLPLPLTRQLMSEASRYASLKLAEMESKACFREKIRIS